MKKLIRSDKKYTFLDFLTIPIAVSPFPSIVILVLRIVSAFIPSLSVLATAAFTDSVIAAANGTATASAVFLPLAALFGITLYNYTNGFFQEMAYNKRNIILERRINTEILEKRASLEYKHIENNDTHDLITRACANPSGEIMWGFNTAISVVSMFVNLGSLLTLLLAQVWWAGIIIFVVSVPLFIIAAKGGKKSYAAHKDASKLSRRENYLHSVLSDREGAQERAVFNYTDKINEDWHEHYEKARKMYVKVGLRNFLRRKGGSTIFILIALFMIAVLIFPLSRGEITIGMFIGLVSGVFSIVQMISWQLTGVMEGVTYRQNYLKDLNAFCALSEREGALDTPQKGPVFETLEFKNVTFAYPECDKYILKNCSFKLENGVHYAFVGENGAGKTTITKLICGMYDNYEGDILLNGKELRAYPLGVIKDMFSVVFQDYARYCVSLRESVMLGDVRLVDQDRFNDSVNKIGLDQAIDKLPKGADTPVGKIITDGVDLSGGEWQRIAIARSLYSSAQVRILDEPTAALDPVAESEVYHMFDKISKNKTTIFITHRLGAARLADQIIVLKNGGVDEIGSHDELLSSGGLYAEMFESQRSWYK